MTRKARHGGKIVTSLENPEDAESAVLSLIFAKGSRPDAGAIATAGLAEGSSGGFSVSARPPAGGEQGWLELLSTGLTFDCLGISPGDGIELPPRGALLGLDSTPDGEAVVLQPGPHIAAGRGLLPVVRVLSGIGLRLAALDGVKAVCWQPAGSWMEPAYFRRVVGDWFAGGAFPALGLTTLRRESNGAMVSLGLGLLIGQELRFEPERALSAGAVARISVRLIHELVENGPLAEAKEFQGPDGEVLLAVPVRDGQQLRVMVRK